MQELASRDAGRGAIWAKSSNETRGIGYRMRQTRTIRLRCSYCLIRDGSAPIVARKPGAAQGAICGARSTLPLNPIVARIPVAGRRVVAQRLVRTGRTIVMLRRVIAAGSPAGTSAAPDYSVTTPLFAACLHFFRRH